MTGRADSPQMIERHVPAEFDAPFLEAKVQRPAPADHLVARTRLRDSLELGVGSELTIVSGPAGSGKSTVLIDWIASHGGETASWITLDDRDNDPVNFWTAVLASLAIGAHRPAASALARLADRVRDEPSRLIDAIGEALPTSTAPPVLVLDDYHAIVDEHIHAGVQLAARYLHDRVRLVIATRTTPPLSLSRLRSHGRLCEVRFDDLRFTPDEGLELFDRLGVDGTDLANAGVIASTEGWAVALYVAAVSERRRQATGEPASTAAPRRHLSEYLVEEVLADLPGPHGDFLLTTAVLDPLTVDRCNAVTDRTDAASVLHELERSTQFVQRRDADGRWFRCHALLRELLLAEAERRGLDLRDLRRRAAAAAESEGDAAYAIDALLDAGDHERAAQLIGSAWIDHTNRGRFGTVMAWVERWAEAAGPSNSRPADPSVAIVGAWSALHTGRLDDVEHWLGRASATDHTEPLSDGSASLVSAIEIARNSHRRRVGDVGAALASAEAAVSEERDAASPWRAVALVGRGATRYWAGDDEGAGRDLVDAVDLAERAGLNVPQVMGKGYLALLAIRAGDLALARTLAEAGVARAEKHRLATYDQAAAPTLALARVSLADVDLERADSHLAEAERLAAAGHERLLLASVRLARSDLAHLSGDARSASSILAEGIELCAACPDPGVLRDELDGAGRRRGDARLATQLTERELVVLRLLASRLSLPEIARELNVSPNTVKSQAAAVRSKLGASSRAEAVGIARDGGLLP
ncbi:MAG: LuxR C-terminal-related transcriptional regulator [Actinomycetota bacterium]